MAALVVGLVVVVTVALGAVTARIDAYRERRARCAVEVRLYVAIGGAAAVKLAAQFSDGGPEASCVAADALRALVGRKA